jgi:trimethylamine--corrinoid protein Co-methyltransferase
MILMDDPAGRAPRLRVLSDEQCEALFEAALACLARVGVQVENARALALLAGAGAAVEGRLARIPPGLIRDALGAAPEEFTLWGRDPARAIRVRPGRVHFGPGLTNTYFMDPETGARRQTRRGDPAMTARVADALPNLDYVMGLGMIGDAPPDRASVYEFAELIANTTKPIIAWAHTPANVAAMGAMAAAVVGDAETLRRRPLFALFSTYPSPLRHTREDLANLMWAAEHGIPAVYLGGPTVGLESPVTGASALVLHLASVLSGLAVVQLVAPGAPMAVGGVPSAMDMRTLRPAYGSPEMSLHSAAACEVARYLGLPFMGTAGASESKLPDAQAGIEAAQQVLMAALSGAALVHDAGFLDCADIGSLGMLAMADEIIAMTARMLRGVDVSPEAIMLDLIAEVGPGGSFLGEPRSVALARREIWVPSLLDRAPYAAWAEAGATDMAARLHARVGKILATHRPPPLDPAVAAQIEAIRDATDFV